ncbi:hypothetical protein K8S19_00910 [bacterium]|nr:hypothetical protein [bacterium]
MQLVLVKIAARSSKAVKIQEVLTKHGCSIQMRLGMHEAAGDSCAEDGLIILKITPGQEVVNNLTADLQAVGDVEVKAVLL